MIAKFPRHIRDRWSQQVLAIRKLRGKEPSLAFVEEEALLVADSLFSNNSFELYLVWTDSGKNSGKNITCSSTTIQEDVTSMCVVQLR